MEYLLIFAVLAGILFWLTKPKNNDSTTKTTTDSYKCSDVVDIN